MNRFLLYATLGFLSIANIGCITSMTNAMLGPMTDASIDEAYSNPPKYLLVPEGTKMKAGVIPLHENIRLGDYALYEQYMEQDFSLLKDKAPLLTEEQLKRMLPKSMLLSVRYQIISVGADGYTVRLSTHVIEKDGGPPILDRDIDYKVDKTGAIRNVILNPGTEFQQILQTESGESEVQSDPNLIQIVIKGRKHSVYPVIRVERVASSSRSLLASGSADISTNTIGYENDKVKFRTVFLQFFTKGSASGELGDGMKLYLRILRYTIYYANPLEGSKSIARAGLAEFAKNYAISQFKNQLTDALQQAEETKVEGTLRLGGYLALIEEGNKPIR